jgi:DNA topoisomerase III
VERFLKIKNFIPEDFWSISCELETTDPDERSGFLLTKFSWARGRLYDKLSCILLYEICVEGAVATVIDCHSRPATKQRPVPLNTIELQKRASRFLRMSSEETMAVKMSSLLQSSLFSPH